jgi:hypothetical protein
LRSGILPLPSGHTIQKKTAALFGLNGAAAYDSNFPPIATGCVAARRAKVRRASALAVKETLAHAVMVGTSVGIPGEKFDSLNRVQQLYRQFLAPVSSRIRWISGPWGSAGNGCPYILPVPTSSYHKMAADARRFLAGSGKGGIAGVTSSWYHTGR